jgi:hypothetical protein
MTVFPVGIGLRLDLTIIDGASYVVYGPEVEMHHKESFEIICEVADRIQLIIPNNLQNWIFLFKPLILVYFHHF